MSDYSTNILADFESLYDINFGIVKMIKEKFNSKELNQNILNADNYFLRYSIYTMETNDVCNLINMDRDTYDDIIGNRKNYLRALELSPKTVILELLEMYMKTDGVINVHIFCKNILQKHFIKSYNHNIPIIMKAEDIKISSFDVYYINEYKSLLDCDGVYNGKEIIIPNYWFNLEPPEFNKPNLAVSIIMSATNKIKTICPYKNFVLPADEN